jgi:hypothetical protein
MKNHTWDFGMTVEQFHTTSNPIPFRTRKNKDILGTTLDIAYALI